MVKKILAAALLMAGAGQVSGAGPGPCGRDNLVPFPLGVADGRGRVGYVSNGRDGVDALDLRTGEALWSSDVASDPLIAFGPRLVAGRRGRDENVLTVVVLDARRNGQSIFESDVKFPPWVSVSLKGDDRFWLRPGLRRVGRDCELILEWQARAAYEGGAPPPEWVEQREKKAAGGKVFINLRTGRSKMESGEASPGYFKNSPPLPKPAGPWQYEAHAAEGYVVGANVYYLVAETQASGSPHRLVLKARELASGKLLWERSVRADQSMKAPPLRP